MQSGGSKQPDSKGVRDWGRRAERKMLGRKARRQAARRIREGARGRDTNGGFIWPRGVGESSMSDV